MTNLKIKNGYFKGEVISSRSTLGIIFDINFEYLPTDLQIAICEFARSEGLAGHPEIGLGTIASLYASSWELEETQESATNLGALSWRIDPPFRDWERIIKDIGYFLLEDYDAKPYEWEYVGAEQDNDGTGDRYIRYQLRHNPSGASLTFTPIERELLIEADTFFNGEPIIFYHDFRAEMIRPEPGFKTYPDFKATIDLYQPLTSKKILSFLPWIPDYLSAYRSEKSR